mgnify:CR=1 FL=1
MFEKYVKDYNDAIFETDKEAALAVVEAAVENGVTPEEVVFKIVMPAVEDMMQLVINNLDTNLSQHFMVAQIASEVTEKMLALFSAPPEIIGKVVIGSSVGDLHSLGKRIVIGCLKAMMVDVVDLGVNVSAVDFVNAAVEHDAQVIAVSSMMMHTATGEEGSLQIRELLHERGLEKQIKLIVGGSPFRYDNELYTRVGADDWAPDGISAAKIICQLIHEVQAS